MVEQVAGVEAAGRAGETTAQGTNTRTFTDPLRRTSRRHPLGGGLRRLEHPPRFVSLLRLPW